MAPPDENVEPIQAAAQGTLQMHKDNALRRKLDNYAKNIGSVDGSNKDELRLWIRAVDHAAARCGAPEDMVLDMVSYLVKAALADVVDDAVTDLSPGVTPAWKDVKEVIKKHFVGPEEEDYMRDKVQRATQQPFELVRDYTTRFTAGVASAYTVDQLKESMLKDSLKRKLIDGLRDKQLRVLVKLAPGDALTDVAQEANRVAPAFPPP